MSQYTIEIVLNPIHPVVEVPLQITGPAMGPVPWQNIVGKPETFPPSAHIHVIADVIGLQSTLDAKAPIAHSHGIVDVTGLQAALDSKAPVSHAHIIGDVTGLQVALDEKAAAIHVHAIADVTGLQGALDGKAALSHTHVIADITGLQATLDQRGIPAGGTAGQVLAKVDETSYNVTWITPALGGGGSVAWVDITGKPSTFPPSVHAHVIADVTNLQTSLDGKAAASHTHAIADVTGLQVALDGKAATSHTHIIANVTGLQTALDGKQASGSYAAAVHTHVIADITGLQSTIDQRGIPAGGTAGQVLSKVDGSNYNVTWTAPTGGSVAWADITGKPSTFPPSTHGHVIADVTGLQTILDGKAALSHTHVIADITGLQTALNTQGMPTGGAAGQVLTKVNATNYNATWQTVTGGTPGPTGPAGPAGLGFKTEQTLLTNFSTNQESTITTGINLAGNKWGVSIVEEWDATAGESDYQNFSLLCHFNGSNGSSTFTDSSPRTKTLTPNGGAQIKTDQSKFGGASAYFSGAAQYVSSSSSSDFAFGTEDFTVECWVYSSDVSFSNQRGFLQTSDSAGGLKITFTTGIAINFGSPSTGSVSANVCGVNVSSGATLIQTNTWYHIALVRSSGVSTLYINGSSVGSASTPGNCSGTYLSIGGYYSTSFLYQGYLDELRIIKGVAKYTGSFTPPSTAFLDYPPTTETKYIGSIGGLNDTAVDYGIEKLSNTSLKIRKMSATGNPVTGGGLLGSIVNRVYVNLMDFGATEAASVPAGGTAGQVLTKVNGTDYNYIWQTPSGGGGPVAWADITGKPSQFPPETHAHGISDVTGLQTALDGKAASVHTHAIADVTGLQTLLDATNGTALNQATVKLVRKASAGTITKGQVVYIVGSQGTHLTVELADADAEATAATTIGVAMGNITNTVEGYIIVQGFLDGLSNLPTTSFTDGQALWLSSTAGAWTTTRPTQPAHGVFLGWVVSASNGAAGRAYIKIINGQELDELHDVLITSPTDGQVLAYEAASGLWKNVPATSGPTITSGTASPSGGSDGDIYLQYTT